MQQKLNVIKFDKLHFEHSLEDTKFNCTIIIATGIEVKYTKNENSILTIVFQVIEEAGRFALVPIAWMMFDPTGTGKENPAIFRQKNLTNKSYNQIKSCRQICRNP
jgi:hypothetical protein